MPLFTRLASLLVLPMALASAFLPPAMAPLPLPTTSTPIKANNPTEGFVS